MGTAQKKYILEADGSGVGLIDYDNDGWLDIYIVNGSTYDALQARGRAPCCVVSQQPRWNFYRCDSKAGVGNDRWGFGVAMPTSITMAGPIFS